MTAALRRGACPTLAAPMASGDGLLVRLVLPDGLSPAQFAGLANAASAFGNGMIEVTSRGSLQLRGLRPETVAGLADAVADLGIAPPDGPPVLTGPLAGLDPAEIADPRPLAAALRRFDKRLPPKVSVVVDGGGALHLDAVQADLRLRATTGGWLVSAGGVAAGRAIGVFDAAGAIAAGLALLDLLSQRWARGRDIDVSGLRQPGVVAAPTRPLAQPVGRFSPGSGFARGIAPAFGQADGETFALLAGAAEGVTSIRPCPGRALMVLGSGVEADLRLVAAADRLGFITDPGDARLAVVACAGAPACASARLPTRAMAGAVAAAGRAPAGVRLHLSGCAKRCAQPDGAAATLLVGPDGPAVTGEGFVVPDGLRAFLLAQAEAVLR